MAQQGLSNLALGQALGGVAHTTIGDWLAGARPRASTLAKLADFFSVSVDDLLDDSRDLPPHPLRKSAMQAHEAFPDDLRAGQAASDSANFRRQWKTTSLETARYLREKAGELIARAEELESPFSREVREESPEIEQRLAEIDERGRARQYEQRKRRSGDQATG